MNRELLTKALKISPLDDGVKDKDGTRLLLFSDEDTETLLAFVKSCAGTPSSHWLEEGQPDPFADQEGYHNHDRSMLHGGKYTDDEVANMVFLNPGIANLTTAKERIRWLSRALEKQLAKNKPSVQLTTDLQEEVLELAKTCPSLRPAVDMDAETLVQTALEVYARAGMYGTKVLHDRAMELREELLLRCAK